MELSEDQLAFRIVLLLGLYIAITIVQMIVGYKKKWTYRQSIPPFAFTGGVFILIFCWALGVPLVWSLSAGVLMGVLSVLRVGGLERAGEEVRTFFRKRKK